MDCVDFDALEGRSRDKMPAASWAFLETGANDEISVKENVTAWRNLRLRPRVLNDITKIDTSLTLLGSKLSSPIAVAPTGRHKLFHPEGECASARGAAAMDMPFVLPTNANRLIEDVAAERKSAPQWFQLYMWDKRAEVEALLDRVQANGFSAIFLTVDAAVSGWSPSSARHPHEPSPDIRNINMPGSPMARTAYDAAFKGKVSYPATWSDLEWLVKRVKIPVMVKGVLRADDAKRSIDCGAAGVIVSNHGGRHLDTTVTTVDALREIAPALAGKGEIIVDSGIRRGTDIFKALALGAHAVMIGRPVLWGLTLDGAEGVKSVMEYFRAEFVHAMQSCGTATLADIKPDLLAPPR
jgi:4-hydroxymandelate oxidase